MSSATDSAKQATSESQKHKHRHSKDKSAADASETSTRSVNPDEGSLRRLSDSVKKDKGRDNTASASQDSLGGKKPKTVERTTTSSSVQSGDSGSIDVDISEQPKEFLLQRINALDRQLRIRNSDCSRLLQERHALLPLKQKCESQTEMIEALQDKVLLLQAQHVSALETIEQLKKQLRNEAHEERVRGFQRQMGNDGDADVGPPTYRATQGPKEQGSASLPVTNPATSRVRVTGITPYSGPSLGAANSGPQQTRLAPGGTVVNTAVGPQIIYDSSDISSVGFQAGAKVPYDFLGGPAAQEQYARTVRFQQQPNSKTDNNNKKNNSNSASAFDEGEGAEVSRVMNMAREEADMEVKYAEVESKEEQELKARIAALKKR